ncbi:MAG TPA: LysR family transcriptional regulator [Steroidobacteraceae bacterium]|nr:LysR family transcriptional regulator [Steroidobacteraceae bacterium]
MKFTLRQLSYFVSAAESGSITLASKRARISQPAISTAISHIERELDVQLFLRHHAQGLSLTPAGRAVLRDAKQLLAQADGLYSAAADVGRLPRGELSVGWFSTLAPIVMPELASAFLKAYPDARLRSTENDQEGLLAALRRAETEIAVTYDLAIGEDIEFAPLAGLAPYALLGASHPLAREPELKLAQLAPLPMVLLDMPMSREYFLALFIRERLEPTIAWSSRQMDAVRTLVANGLGYTLANVRPRADMALDGRRLRRVPLSGDLPPVHIGIATLKELKKTRLAEAFRRHCTQHITAAHIPGMADLESPARRKRR